MNRIRASVACGVILAGTVVCGGSFAQAQATPPAKTPAPAASTPASSNPSAVAQVESWTTKQWDGAKKEWAKDKTKWAGCQKQSDQQKLEGRKSCSFLYKCMSS